MVMVPEAVRLDSVKLPEKRAEPWTENRDDGDVVPIPTLPLALTKKCVAVVEPIANSGVFVASLSGLIENMAHGVDVPTPAKTELALSLVPTMK